MGKSNLRVNLTVFVSSLLVGMVVSCSTSQNLSQNSNVTILRPQILSPQVYDATQKVVENYKEEPQIEIKEIVQGDTVSPEIVGRADENQKSSTNSGFIWPVSGVITSKFGKRWGRFHSGVDVAAPKGTRVKASAAGKVLAARRMRGYGWTVIVGHKDNTQTLYAHLSRVHVRIGQFIPKGRTIARVGRTGRATGYHLHFEIRMQDGTPHNPISLLPSVESVQGLKYSKKILSKLKKNGHTGDLKSY